MALSRPTKIVSAKERRNLRAGGSPGRPKRSPAEKAGTELLKKIFRSKEYLDNFRQRAVDGKLQAGVEAYGLQVVFGKPKDILDVNQGPTKVVIVHRLRSDQTNGSDDSK
jgi:hypothetical protein